MYQKTAKRYREFIWTGVRAYDQWGEFRYDAAVVPDTRHGIFNAATAFVREARSMDADAPRNSLAGILRKDLLDSARAKLQEFRRRRLEGTL